METYKCNLCRGTGLRTVLVTFWNTSKVRIKEEHEVEIVCMRCKGVGVVDWLTNVFNGCDERIDESESLTAFLETKLFEEKNGNL